MAIGRCTICNGFTYSFERSHTCPPRFECREDDDHEDDWTPLYARDAELAAEKFIDRRDCENEYTIASGRREAKVLVKDASGKVTTFEVSGEFAAQYRAREVAQ